MGFDAVVVICDTATRISTNLTGLLMDLVPIIAVGWGAYHVVKFGMVIIPAIFRKVEPPESSEEREARWSKEDADYAVMMSSRDDIDGWYDRFGEYHSLK